MTKKYFSLEIPEFEGFCLTDDIYIFRIYGIESEKFSPVGLSVEFIREPATVLIIDDNPEFSWELPKTAVKQISYQILIILKIMHIFILIIN